MTEIIPHTNFLILETILHFLLHLLSQETVLHIIIPCAQDWNCPTHSLKLSRNHPTLPSKPWTVLHICACCWNPPHTLTSYNPGNHPKPRNCPTQLSCLVLMTEIIPHINSNYFLISETILHFLLHLLSPETVLHNYHALCSWLESSHILTQTIPETILHFLLHLLRQETVLHNYHALCLWLELSHTFTQTMRKPSYNSCCIF